MKLMTQLTRKGQLPLTLVVLVVLVVGAAVIVFELVRPDIFGMVLMGLGALAVFLLIFVMTTKGKIPVAKAVAVPLAIAVGLGLALAAVTAAETVRLQADMSRVYWLDVTPEPPITLSGTYDGSSWSWQMKSITFYFEPNDIPKISDRVYIIICYSAVDIPLGYTYVDLIISNRYMPWPQVRIFADEVTGPTKREVCKATLTPVDINALKEGRITVELWGPPPTSSDTVSITITKVGIAPVKTVNNESNGKVGSNVNGGVDVTNFNIVKWLAIGGFVIAVAALAIVMASKRR